MTPIAWIVRHRLDKHPREHALYYREEEAHAHAAQYASGVCTVVPVVDGAEAAERIAELEAMCAEYRMEVERCFDIAQRLDAMNPEAPGAFTGTPSERIARSALKDAP